MEREKECKGQVEIGKGECTSTQRLYRMREDAQQDNTVFIASLFAVLMLDKYVKDLLVTLITPEAIFSIQIILFV